MTGSTALRYAFIGALLVAFIILSHISGCMPFHMQDWRLHFALEAYAQDADAGARAAAKLDQVSEVELVKMVDREFIRANWKVVGTESCHGQQTEIVENPFPFAVVEVVLAPDETFIKGGSAMVKGLGGTTQFKSGTHRPDPSNLHQFYITRVYTFIPEQVARELQGQGLSLVAHPRGIVPDATTFLLNYASETDRVSADRPQATKLAGLSPDQIPRGCEVRPTKDCFRTWGRRVPEDNLENEKVPYLAVTLVALRTGRIPEYYGVAATQGGPSGALFKQKGLGGRPSWSWWSSTRPLEPRTGHYLQLLRPDKPQKPIEIGDEKFLRDPDTLKEAGKGRALLMLYGIFRESRCRAPQLQPDK
jgi:hypothetical protein